METSEKDLPQDRVEVRKKLLKRVLIIDQLEKDLSKPISLITILSLLLYRNI